MGTGQHDHKEMGQFDHVGTGQRNHTGTRQFDQLRKRRSPPNMEEELMMEEWGLLKNEEEDGLLSLPTVLWL